MKEERRKTPPKIKSKLKQRTRGGSMLKGTKTIFQDYRAQPIKIKINMKKTPTTQKNSKFLTSDDIMDVATKLAQRTLKKKKPSEYINIYQRICDLGYLSSKMNKPK